MTLPPLRGGAIALALTLALGPAQASKCWLPTLAAAESGNGESLDDPRFAPLLRASQRAELQLRTDPVLNALPALRFQARRSLSYIDNERPGYTAQVWVSLHARSVWSGTACGIDAAQAGYLNTLGVEIGFNTVEQLISIVQAQGEPGEPLVASLDPTALDAYRRSGLLRGQGEALRAFRADGGPVLVPVSVADHLGLWEQRLERIARDGGEAYAGPELAALRRHRSTLTAAQRGGQAFISAATADARLWAYAGPDDDQAVPLYQIAPELRQAAADPLAVRLLTVSYYGPEGEPASERPRDWVDGFDAARARALFEGAQR